VARLSPCLTVKAAASACVLDHSPLTGARTFEILNVWAILPRHTSNASAVDLLRRGDVGSRSTS